MTDGVDAPEERAEREELRRQAEALLPATPADESVLTAEQARRLVHELRVHQVELEMQNEELRRAQEELEQARDRYADLYDFAPVGYLTLDDKGVIREANLTAASLLAVERHSLIGAPFSRFLVREDQDLLYHHQRRMREGAGRESWETRLRRPDAPDGTAFWAQLDCRSVTDTAGRFVACRSALTDITRRKQMEQELIHLERLRAAAELSAGVSHNLNNILTSVLGPAELLRRVTDDPRLLREVDDITAAALRARDLVRDLHQSVRTDEDEALRPVSVDRVVLQAVQTSRPRWKDEPEARGISIDVVAELEQVAPIRGTETGLHGVLTNLILNAVDAMPRGGTVTIRARQSGDQVRITVSDTGTGMDESTRRRVFEPFFTTKMDVGSGLGLSTAWNTVTRWGGTIEVTSAPGEGATFDLCFPACTEEVPREEPRPDAAVGRPGRILVVEDDDAVRNLLSRLLGRRHEVDAVADAQQALDGHAPARYDVVVVDLGMPGMPGDQLARRMRQADPQLATVLVTGWTLPQADARTAAFDFQVRKPFDDLGELEGAVAQAVALHDARAAERS